MGKNMRGKRSWLKRARAVKKTEALGLLLGSAE